MRIRCAPLHPLPETGILREANSWRKVEFTEVKMLFARNKILFVLNNDVHTCIGAKHKQNVPTATVRWQFGCDLAPEPGHVT